MVAALDLERQQGLAQLLEAGIALLAFARRQDHRLAADILQRQRPLQGVKMARGDILVGDNHRKAPVQQRRSEEHTSELQSLMRISYAVFCLKKNKTRHNTRRRAKK